MAKEMEVTAKTYKEIRVVPGAAKVSGEMELNQKTLGFYLTAFTAAMLARSESATLITDAASVKVTKASGSIWVAGDPVFWLEVTDNYTNVDDGSGYLVGKVAQAATSPAVIGYIDFSDFYPVARGHQIGTVQIPYKISATFPDAVVSLFAVNMLTSGTVNGSYIDLTQNASQTSGYVKALRVHLNSDVKLPASGHAIYGKIDLKTNGHAHGMVAAIGAELIMPASSAPRGTFYGGEVQIGIPTGAGWASAGPCAFLRFGLSGDAKALFEAGGYLFDITGVAEANDALCDNGGSPSEADGGIRCRINGADKWLLYADDPET